MLIDGKEERIAIVQCESDALVVLAIRDANGYNSMSGTVQHLSEIIAGGVH